MKEILTKFKEKGTDELCLKDKRFMRRFSEISNWFFLELPYQERYERFLEADNIEKNIQFKVAFDSKSLHKLKLKTLFLIKNYLVLIEHFCPQKVMNMMEDDFYESMTTLHFIHGVFKKDPSKKNIIFVK